MRVPSFSTGCNAADSRHALRSHFGLPAGAPWRGACRASDPLAEKRDHRARPTACPGLRQSKERPMSQIVYIVGAIVIVVAILGFLGLR